jgi:CheY-like chemotaxis protein
MPMRASIVDDPSVMRSREMGHDADDTLQENMVDLILCDINLPVMYGLEFIKLFPWVANAEDVP